MPCRYLQHEAAANGIALHDACSKLFDDKQRCVYVDQSLKSVGPVCGTYDWLLIARAKASDMQQ